MNGQTITIEIDGQSYTTTAGKMLIEVMDRHRINVPRFCYHPRLSVAANCRMCMVEVEKIGKPLPACATPVADNMVVKSRSALALEGQKGTMEFLLINHPLDCPVCDQGGECELQDVSLAHGQSYSRFHEQKRVVPDEDIGSLISTDMTRCIHCTRCVRFGVEVAGMPELGVTGRGENIRIGTYVKHSVSSELSGNMIDVCPVGALNSKPYRMTARAWEMERHPVVANHDCLGSNCYVHTLRGRVMRVLPKECETINLSWLSDRDRFSYTALEHPQRCHHPRIYDSIKRRHVSVDWHNAIDHCQKLLSKAIQLKETKKIGVLVGANTSLEEMHLLARLCQKLGIDNIDHRLDQIDFSFQQDMPVAPWLDCKLDQLATVDAALLIGADARKLQPMFGLRLRQAALRGGQISTVNLHREDLNYPSSEQLVGDPEKMFSDLLSVFRYLSKHGSGAQRKSQSQKIVAQWSSKFIVQPQDIHKRLAHQLLKAESALVVLGSGAFALPNFSAIRAVAQALAEITGARFGFLPAGANAVGAWYSGCLPHRKAIDQTGSNKGLDVDQMLRKPRDIYLLYNCEPLRDCQLAKRAEQCFKKASAVVSINPFVLDEKAESLIGAHLPLATPFEAPGTYVNAMGDWQYHQAAVAPEGQVLPGWKILSMLARACGLDEYDYRSCDDLTAEINQCYRGVTIDSRGGLEAQPEVHPPVQLRRLVRPSVFQGDAIQRRSSALQDTIDAARDHLLLIHPQDAQEQHIAHGDGVELTQGKDSFTMRAMLDDSIAPGTVSTAMGTGCQLVLGEGFKAIKLSRSLQKEPDQADDALRTQ